MATKINCQVNTFSDTRYKINIQILVVFLFTNTNFTKRKDKSPYNKILMKKI